MKAGVIGGTATLAEFVAGATIGPEARERAAAAFRDTIGVMLAGAGEPAAGWRSRWPRRKASGVPRPRHRRSGPARARRAGQRRRRACARLRRHVLRVARASELRAGAGDRWPRASWRTRAPTALLDAYVVGFELECRLGNVMNPRHYHQRGWHCTSSIGTLGAAAAAARVLGLDAHATQHALGIAASSACGLKENIGSMVKPLHAGMAARNGVMAARLAQRGFTASPHAIDGPQGYLAAMDSEQPSLDAGRGRPGRPVGDPRDRRHGQAVSLVRRHASAARRADRHAAPRGLHRRQVARHRRRSGLDDAAAADSSEPGDRPRSEVQHAVLRGGGGRVRRGSASTRSTSSTSSNPAVQALMPRVTLRANAAFDTGGAAVAGARHGARCATAACCRSRPTARAAIPGG